MKEWPISVQYDENESTRNFLTVLNNGKPLQSQWWLAYEQLDVPICLSVGEQCWPWDFHLMMVACSWCKQVSCICKRTGTSDKMVYLMCHQTVCAKGAELVIVKSSTTTDYRIPAAGRWMKIVPYVIHEQAMPEKKLAESATFRCLEKGYTSSELM